MRKIKILVLFSLILLLVSCRQQKVSVNFIVLEYDEIVIDSMEINKGEDFLLPHVEHDWYEFKGWYKDQSYTTLIENVVTKEDVTLYGKFEPSLSIAVLGNPNDTQYDDIILTIAEYSIQNNRIYDIYDTSTTDPYEPIVALDAIDDAVADGAKIIILTSGYYHAEATYIAQSKYPDINFVLIGGEPKEHAFYSKPVILTNTITTKYPHELSGFLAGYSAVYEGYYNLGFLNVDGYSDTTSGVSFLAGAYYAANQLEKEIIINAKAYKNFDHPSLLIKNYYLKKASDLDVDLIYTFEDDELSRFEELAVNTDVKIVLAPNSYSNHLESILSMLKLNIPGSVEMILNQYFTGDFIGGNSIETDVTMDFSNYVEFNHTKFVRIKNLIAEGSILVPTDYSSFIGFMETLNIDVPNHIDEYLLESVHTIEDFIE